MGSLVTQGAKAASQAISDCAKSSQAFSGGAWYEWSPRTHVDMIESSPSTKQMISTRDSLMCPDCRDGAGSRRNFVRRERRECCRLNNYGLKQGVAHLQILKMLEK